TLRTSYHEQRQFYEGKQDLQAQVEIKAAEQVVASMQSNFTAHLCDLAETEVDALAKQFDYAEVKLREHAETAALKLNQAINHRARKEAESDAAKNESNDKERKAPEGGKRRFPEGEVRPRTSADAAVLLERGRALHEQRQIRKQEFDDNVTSLSEI